MPESADVVIVGGGVVGSSVAYHLKADGFRGRVVVLERDPTYEFASTVLSMGGVRQQFETEVSIRMMRYSIQFYERFGDLLAVDGERPDCGLNQVGYMFLANAANHAILKRRYDLQRSLGVEAEILDRPGILARHPGLYLDDIDCAFFCSRDGYVDPHRVLQAFIRKAKALGVEYRAGEVSEVMLEAGRVAGVRTAAGEQLMAPVAVNAAGAHARSVAQRAGVDLPVEPYRRQLFVGEPPEPLGLRFPMTIDPTGTHWRPDTPQTIVIAKTKWEEPPGVRFGWEPDWFRDKVWPDLAHRCPLLDRLRLHRGWGGLYEVTPDHNAILGEHPERPGFVLATGFSGHGLMMSPCTGKLASEWIRLGHFETLDASPLALSRFRAGAPVHREAVI
jgi:glycine/D-amino acid oxidase-like deaminating enzyme